MASCCKHGTAKASWTTRIKDTKALVNCRGGARSVKSPEPRGQNKVLNLFSRAEPFLHEGRVAPSLNRHRLSLGTWCGRQNDTGSQAVYHSQLGTCGCQRVPLQSLATLARSLQVPDMALSPAEGRAEVLCLFPEGL